MSPTPVRWLFGDQLGPHFLGDHDGPVLMVESRAVFRRRRFHRAEAQLVLSVTRHRAAELTTCGCAYLCKASTGCATCRSSSPRSRTAAARLREAARPGRPVRGRLDPRRPADAGDGVFSERQAGIVADAVIARARARGEEPSTTYDDRGICYLEFGDDRVAKVDVTFQPGHMPAGQFEEPSAALAVDKSEFGSSRIKRWFGRDRSAH
jgi:hypothetical protein